MRGRAECGPLRECPLVGDEKGRTVEEARHGVGRWGFSYGVSILHVFSQKWEEGGRAEIGQPTWRCGLPSV